MMEENMGDVGDDPKCVGLLLPKHIAAYKKGTGLCGDDAKPLACDNSLLERVTGNYVIVKKIIRNLSWQDKLMCKIVCSTWHAAVLTLQKEQMYAVDFCIHMRAPPKRLSMKFLKSNTFYAEPLAVLTFVNGGGFVASIKCKRLLSNPCDPACQKEHYLIDFVRYKAAAPKNCMLTVKSCLISYMPLPPSITYGSTIKNKTVLNEEQFISGVFIPAMPNVKFTIINIKSVKSLRKDFYDVVDKLAETQHIKGAIVFANDSYLLHSVEDIIFLNYFKDVQHNVPYALGGCMVQDTISSDDEINGVIDEINGGNGFTSENLVSIGLFSVTKDVPQENASNFDMYSVIIESTEWSKDKIQSTINEFSKRVPHYEHSVAIKLSCIGRDQKHDTEQQSFRAVFPNTRIIGCYGNGELGINHPPRPKAEESPTSAKRHCLDPEPQQSVMYSYSTVFVYIGWGKCLYQPPSTSKV